MASRRTARILLIAGGLLLVLGLGAIAWGSLPAGAQETLPIPPGGENISVFSWTVVAGGSVQGSFSVLNGTPVTVFVYNSADYAAYVSGSNLSGLYTTTSAGGTLNVEVSGYGTFYVVFQHASGYESAEQDVAVDLTVSGLDATFVLPGIIGVGAGIVLIVVGVRQRRALQSVAPSGILLSNVAYAPPPAPPTGPDPMTSGTGMYRIPPPLPGTPETPPTPPIPSAATGIVPATAAASETPPGTIVVTLQNQSATDENVTLYVNGAGAATLTVPAGTTQQASLRAKLASPFGSMVKVEAVTGGGRRAADSIFVGSRGTASIVLRIG